MASKSKSFGRADLVKRLGELGFSRRKSVRIVNVILSCMVRTLRRGRRVEFPFGWLGPLSRRQQERWVYMDDWPPPRGRPWLFWQLDEPGARELDPKGWAAIAGQSRRRRARKSSK